MRGSRFVGVVGRSLLEPLFDYIYAADASTSTHSAEIGSLTYASGDYLFNVLLTYGNATFLGRTVGDWTGQLTTLAPSSPRRAYAADRIADESSDDSLAWAWDSPGVGAVSVTVAVHETGLGLWAQDWWSDGPDSSFLVPGFEVHRILALWVWSDAGTDLAGGTLAFRSDAADVPDIGVVELWTLRGVASGSTTVDIDVTASSGDIQWATWVDIYTV